MRKLLSASLISLMTLSSATAFAAYDGPMANTTTSTVQDALKARDDTDVRLEGYIINYIKEDKYTFQDSTGTIVVEVSNKIMNNVNINEKTKVIIYGEVDSDFGKRNRVDVDRLQVVN